MFKMEREKMFNVTINKYVRPHVLSARLSALGFAEVRLVAVLHTLGIPLVRDSVARLSFYPMWNVIRFCRRIYSDSIRVGS